MTPEGFKKYPMIMLPDGKLVEPASCWLLQVDVFSEREVETAVRENLWSLDAISEHHDGEWLAPVLRKGMRPGLPEWSDELEERLLDAFLSSKPVGGDITAREYVPSKHTGIQAVYDGLRVLSEEGDI